MADYKPWRVDFITDMNVHAFHSSLAHKLDHQKMVAQQYKGGNTTQL